MVGSIPAENLKEQRDEFIIIEIREPDEIPGRQIADSMNIPLKIARRNACHVEG